MIERNEEIEIEQFDYSGVFFDESFSDDELTDELLHTVEQMIENHYSNAIHPYAMQMAIGPYGELDEDEFHKEFIKAGGLGDWDEEYGSSITYTVSKEKIDWSNPFSLLYHTFGYSESDWLENFYMILELREGKTYKNLSELTKELRKYSVLKDFQKAVLKGGTPGLKGLLEISNVCIQYMKNTYEAFDAEISDDDMMKRMDQSLRRISIQNQVVNSAGGAIHSLM